MKKFLEKLEDVIPTLWAIMWAVTITFFSIGATVWTVAWVLKLVGVL